jgi:hypothetical protein
MIAGKFKEIKLLKRLSKTKPSSPQELQLLQIMFTLKGFTLDSTVMQDLKLAKEGQEAWDMKKLTPILTLNGSTQSYI